MPATSPLTVQPTAACPATVYYCKAGLPTGHTVRVASGRHVTSCRGVRLHAVSGEMLHGNSTGKPKASGARCVLVLTSGTIELLDPLPNP